YFNGIYKNDIDSFAERVLYSGVDEGGFCLDRVGYALVFTLRIYHISCVFFTFWFVFYAL
ncbi:hypothetical protein, partial [Bartonella quintana]